MARGGQNNGLVPSAAVEGAVEQRKMPRLLKNVDTVLQEDFNFEVPRKGLQRLRRAICNINVLLHIYQDKGTSLKKQRGLKGGVSVYPEVALPEGGTTIYPEVEPKALVNRAQGDTRIRLGS